MAEGAGATRPLFKAPASGASTRAHHGLVSSHRSSGGGMAHLYRLIFIAALVLFYVSASRAGTIESIVATSTPAPPTYKWRGDTQTQGSKYFATALEACTWSVNIAYGWPVASTTRVSDDEYNCIGQSPPAPFPGFNAGTVYRVLTCVAVGGKPGDSCPVVQSCPAGYFGPLAGMCSREQCPDGTWKQPGTCPAVNGCADLTGKVAGTYELPYGAGSGAKQVCETGLSSGDVSAPGCLITGDANFGYGSPTVWVVKMTVTGAKCAPSGTSYDAGGGGPAPAPLPNKPPTKCTPPLVSGTVNGQTVCVPVGPDTPTKQTGTTSTTTTDASGTTTTKQDAVETTCTGSTCTSTTTTTTTTTTSGGTPTTTTQTQEGTCTRGSPGCGPEEEEPDPSRFGGACGSPFVCDGDAIMCAVALEQHKRNCALFVDSSPESSLYDTEKGKTGTQYGSETVTVGTGSFSQSNAIGGSAQCIADKTVTVWNQQVTLPFSQVCASLQHLGTVLIFVSFLLAYRIVSRG